MTFGIFSYSQILRTDESSFILFNEIVMLQLSYWKQFIWRAKTQYSFLVDHLKLDNQPKNSVFSDSFLSSYETIFSVRNASSFNNREIVQVFPQGNTKSNNQTVFGEYCLKFRVLFHHAWNLWSWNPGYDNFRSCH